MRRLFAIALAAALATQFVLGASVPAVGTVLAGDHSPTAESVRGTR